MKNIIFIGLLVIAGIEAYAQKFEKKQEWDIPVGFTASNVEWMDVDSDSLLDVVITAVDGGGDNVLLMAKNAFPIPFTFQSPLATSMKQVTVYPADVNNDNNTDLVVYGMKSGLPAVALYINQGAFNFAAPVFPPELQNITVKLLRMADLNRDGDTDIALCGSKGAGDFLWVYQRTSTEWVPRDTVSVTPLGLEIFDFDGDGNNDILLSGHNSDSVFTVLIHHGVDFEFQRSTIALGLEGKLSAGDLNGDGYFDAVLAGKKAGADAIVTLRNNNGTFLQDETLFALSNASVFAADMNSDGTTDILLSGKLTSGDTVNLIRKSATDYDTLNHTGVAAQRFGDADRDGDLDVIQLFSSGGVQHLVWYASQADENHGPISPVIGVAVTFYNHLFLFWQKSGDDHTEVTTVTSDVTIEAASENVVSGDFNLTGDLNRRLVSNGNAGTRNFLLLNRIKDGNYFFSIQSVDNSFHTIDNSFNTGNGVCEGTSTACLEIGIEERLTCGAEELKFTAPAPNALWFSFAKGLVGTGPEYSVEASESDTLFSFVFGQGSACSSIRLYAIKVEQTLTKKERTTQYVCEGSTLNFSAESGWESVTWSSDERGFLSNSTNISFVVTGADSVRVLLSSTEGCDIERITALVISKPVITASPDQQILKGQSVSLSATGGAAYAWTPPTGLNQTSTSNPVASPLQTIEYTVTVTDSVGCTAAEKVLVVVQETAFIPNLFTPNQDGNNDDLRIYGLSGVKEFTFTIFNREGNTVYQSTDLGEVTTRGWDGKRNGKEQAGGVYYWKVKGEFNGGGPILLNGKKTGSIVLIR